MFDIDSMIQASDIEEMLIELGVEPVRKKNKNGYELYFKCFNPSHDDTKGKMSMAEKGKYKGLFYCWVCKFRGNIIQLIQYFKSCEFNEAIVWMRDRTGVGDLHGTQSLIYRVKKEKLNYGHKQEEQQLPVYRCPSSGDRPIDSKGSFQEYARSYLASRKINQSTARKFAVHVGVHGQIGDCILIPITFKEKIHSIFYCEPKDGGAKRYPQGSPQSKIFFNYDACKEEGRYTLVESVLDVLMLDSMGFGPAMACFTNMVSDRQIELLRDFDNHAVFPDMDSPRGWDLVNRLVTGLDKSIELILPPVGKDPGDCSYDEVLQAYQSKKPYSDWEVDGYISRAVRDLCKVTRLKK